jgi:AcrR family transcriptional regulator
MTDTRTRIVAATNELFRRQGYNGTALKDVTAAADATTGSLYHFFPGGKSQLAEAVLTESGLAYQQLFEAIADEADDPAQAVADFFDGAAEVLAATGFIDVCPIGTVAREVASTDEALRLASSRVFDGWIGAAAGRFAAAGLSDETSASLAATVVAALEGGFVLARAGRDAGVLRDIGGHVRTLVASQLAAGSPSPARQTTHGP